MNLLTSGGALVAAKIVFVAAGYVIYAGLPRLVSRDAFGTYLVTNSAVAILNAAFVAGTIQAVSKFVAQGPERAAGTLRAALQLHAALAGGVAGAYFILAPLIARALGDESLAPYLQVSAVIPLSYAFYAAMIGYANGLRRFSQQAGFDICYSLLKITFVLGLPWLGYGAFGAVAGFAAASVLILIAASILIGYPATRPTEVGTPARTILQFELTVMGHVALTNLLMQADILMVKAVYPMSGSSAAAALYGAAAKLAQIPYSVLAALNFLVFPYIARSVVQSRPAETAGYIRQALRLGASLVVGPAIVLAALSPRVVVFVFGAEYVDAGPILRVLVCGYIAFSFLTLAATIINASGRPAISVWITAATAAIQVACALVFIPAQGIVGAAYASSGAYAIGAIAATVFLMAKFRAVVPWPTLARVVVAAAIVVAVSRTSVGALPEVVASSLLGTLYVAALIVLREWTVADLRDATSGARANRIQAQSTPS